MGEGTGGGHCPECGAAGLRVGQLVCRGCFVPFSLMPSTGRQALASERDTPSSTDAVDAAGAPPSAQDERTRAFALRPGGVAPGAAETRGDALPRALGLCFPGGEIVPVEPGTRVRIGRDPRSCPEVGFLSCRDNLSRIHAVVAVEADGSAWIADEGSTNGTFVHGCRLAAEERAPLRPGDTVRLAADVTVRVLP